MKHKVWPIKAVHSFTWNDLKSMINLMTNEALENDVWIDVIENNQSTPWRVSGFHVCDESIEFKTPNLIARDSWE